MKKKLIVRLAAGLGNQLFMYAHSYSLSKKLNYDFFIDDTSGFFQKKNQSHERVFRLNFFNINAPVIKKKFKFDNYFTHNYRKILKVLDIFKKKKSFLIESQKNSKMTLFKKNNLSFSNILYIEGNYESEKYFLDSRNDLIQQFKVKKEFIEQKNKYIDMLANSNSVSIHIRRDRFMEPGTFSYRGSQVKKNINLEDVFDYIYKSVNFFEKKIKNPKFFIWSNNFSDLDKKFDKNKFTFIQNNNLIKDFYLFSFTKHFIVSPSSYHWWGAWLNTNPNKICVRPPDFLNPSNNIDFWPFNWKVLV